MFPFSLLSGKIRLHNKKKKVGGKMAYKPKYENNAGSLASEEYTRMYRIIIEIKARRPIINTILLFFSIFE